MRPEHGASTLSEAWLGASNAASAARMDWALANEEWGEESPESADAELAYRRAAAVAVAAWAAVEAERRGL